MTSEFNELLRRLACKCCNGNGRLGGRSLKKTGEYHYYVDEGRTCEECGGTGIAREPGR